MSGTIKINPAVMEDERSAFAVAANEGIRLLMEDTGYTPRLTPTDEQRKLLSKTAYKDNEDAMRKTILARTATLDPDIMATKEQKEEAADLLDDFSDMFDYGGKDWGVLARLGGVLRGDTIRDEQEPMEADDEAPGEPDLGTTPEHFPEGFSTETPDQPDSLPPDPSASLM